MSLNGGAWLDRSAWAPCLELLPYRRRVPQRKKKVKNAKFYETTRFLFVFQTMSSLNYLDGLAVSFSVGLCRSLSWQRWWRCLGVDSEAMGVVVANGDDRGRGVSALVLRVLAGIARSCPSQWHVS